MARTREEAFQLLADDLVKEGLLRLMPRVFGHGVPGRDRRGWNAEEEATADRSTWHRDDAG